MLGGGIVQIPVLDVTIRDTSVKASGWAAIIVVVLIVLAFVFYVDRRWPHIRQGAKAKLRRKKK